MLNTNPRLLMSNFFADYDVIITGPEEFVDSSHDIQAGPDGLGGYRSLSAEVVHSAAVKRQNIPFGHSSEIWPLYGVQLHLEDQAK
jgi:hypothetical protein